MSATFTLLGTYSYGKQRLHICLLRLEVHKALMMALLVCNNCYRVWVYLIDTLKNCIARGIHVR
jgi:hypothetical protein